MYDLRHPIQSKLSRTCMLNLFFRIFVGRIPLGQNKFLGDNTDFYGLKYMLQFIL